MSKEIKEMLSYMNDGIPKSDYARMLDDAVKEIKQSEERRLEYMSINANIADEREVGDYRRAVNQIRENNGFLTDEQMIGFMHITLNTLKTVRFVIKLHPDWNDEVVAEKVLDLEDEGFDVDKATEENLTTV